MDTDFRQFYDLESYIFGVVGSRWREQGWLSAFDLFAIFAWKSSRAREYMVRRVTRERTVTLEEGARELTRMLAAQSDVRSALEYLIVDRKFRLATASALVTVLWPADASVYDRRVCNVLKEEDSAYDFHALADEMRISHVWPGYEAYLAAVNVVAPADLCLRDKDRWLWGASFHRDLTTFVTTGYRGDAPRAELHE